MIDVSFLGGVRVDAQLGPHVLHTDQPAALGGTESAPSPYTIFLGSLASCAGFFVARFCQTRNIPLDGIRLRMETTNDPTTHLASDVRFLLTLPADFPEKYRGSLERVIDQCSVKRTIAAPPTFATVVEIEGEAAAALS